MPNEHKHTNQERATECLENKGGFASLRFSFCLSLSPLLLRPLPQGLYKDITLYLIRRLIHGHRGITRPTKLILAQEEKPPHRDLSVCAQNICTCVVVLTCQRSPARACTMCYLLTYSCYCYFLESFYKELAVALLRVVRHGHGENVVVGSHARFKQVP